MSQKTEYEIKNSNSIKDILRNITNKMIGENICIYSGYMNKYNKNNNVQFLLLKDDILNYRVLTDKQLSYMETLTDKEKMEIFILYNKMMQSINDLL
jgi:hypothetical protein